MRTALILAIATTALAGCTFKSTEVKRAETPPPVVHQPAPTVVTPPAVVYQQQPTAPTISYTVMGDAQFNQAAVQAANWCNSNHGTGARLIDRRRSSGGDVVTFACTAS
jgi:hypothetical protein